ncbi:hypothetical protein HW555_004737 [Spodoptera exigua]|uniref:L antigen family member 3 n=1 Tax=Spodoptera exigua TaxID=7107 RepID=A0A835GKJ0_SPOEX|nr:hypothetical protein HW555_004737 [Spodoptera exigua]KAH9630713.1 hypothetical protein HF086_004004 [Spodoptera exigua]
MNISLTIPFPSPESASLTRDVLNVDKELKRSGVQRKLETNAENLVITFHGRDLKKLRVAVNSMIQNIILVVKTIEQFK